MTFTLLTIGTHVCVQSFLENMPEDLAVQFKRDLSHLEGRETATLSCKDRQILNMALGIHNQEIVHQCTLLADVDPKWSPDLQEVVKRKKRGPQKPRIHMNGRDFMALMTVNALLEA